MLIPTSITNLNHLHAFILTQLQRVYTFKILEANFGALNTPLC